MFPDIIRVLVQRESDGVHPVLHLFGGPFVSLNGRRIEVPEGSKRLLAFVALRSGRVQRSCAAGTLWPGGDDCRAAGNLRSALWRLNKVGLELLDVDKYALTLHERVLVDQQLVVAWAARVAGEQPPIEDLHALPSTPDALDLLPGWYEDWALLERERFRQRLLHALETQSRGLTRRGHHAEAIDAALLVVSADPLRESAQLALVQAHLGENNWMEARRCHDAYAETLRRELGTEPGREFSALLSAHLQMRRSPHNGSARRRSTATH